MSNPGTSSVSINALSIAFPAGCVLFIVTLFLFYAKDSIPSFNVILWAGLPIIAFLIATGMLMASQYMYCKNVDSGKAFMGAIPSIVAVFIGLAISSVSFCRIPVVSIIAPFYKSESDNKNSSNCCKPPPSLESIEAKAPMVSGLAYGFYLFFSMLFGIVIGSETAVVCQSTVLSASN
jgi:hypothetical protein